MNGSNEDHKRHSDLVYRETLPLQMRDSNSAAQVTIEFLRCAAHSTSILHADIFGGQQLNMMHARHSGQVKHLEYDAASYCNVFVGYVCVQ